MHDPTKPPEGDISKCPFFAALSGAMSAFAQGAAAKPSAQDPGAAAPTPAPPPLAAGNDHSSRESER